MKHLIRLVLVVALMAGFACADYIAIEPVGPMEIAAGDVGTELVVELVWYHDAYPLQYAVGFEFMIGVDISELTLVLPPDPIGPAGPAYNGDFGKVNLEMIGDDLHVWNLQAEFVELTTTPTVLINDLKVILTAPLLADADDLWVYDQAGTQQGIAVYMPPDYAVVGTIQPGYGAGPDVYIPEPATTALLGIGLLGALLRKRS